MSAIRAIKAEIAECEQERSELAPLLDTARDELTEATAQFERLQDRVTDLSLRIERLNDARSMLENR